MYRAYIWGRVLDLQGGPWTFLEYKRLFGGDMLQDISAAQKRETYHISDWLKVAYAMYATANKGCESFEEWCAVERWPEFSLDDGGGAGFVAVIVSAIEAEMFRRRPSIIGRIRARFRRLRASHRGARRMGRIPRRASAR